MPVALLTGYYPATRKGLTPYDVTQDYGKAANAWYEFNSDFQPDCLSGADVCGHPRPGVRSHRRQDSEAGPATVWPRRPASSTPIRSGCPTTSTICSSTTPPTSCSTTTCRGWPRPQRVRQTGLAARHDRDRGRPVLDDALGRSRRAGQPGQALSQPAGNAPRGAGPCTRCSAGSWPRVPGHSSSTCPRRRSTSSATRFAVSAA